MGRVSLLMLLKNCMLTLLDHILNMLHTCGLLIKQAYLSDMVEAVQRRATKLMVGNRISYKERLLKTGLMSLSSRRMYLDLIIFYLNACIVTMTSISQIICSFIILSIDPII